MPWVFLGKSPLLTGKCIISSHTDPACDQMHKVQLCQEMAQSDPSCWYPQCSRMREGGRNTPTSPGSCGHCQGRGKVREAKGWIFEEFQIRNQTGKNQSFCLHALVWTENLHRIGCTYKTREKTCENQLQITKRKLPKLKRTLHKPQIPLLSMAA